MRPAIAAHRDDLGCSGGNFTIGVSTRRDSLVVQCVGERLCIGTDTGASQCAPARRGRSVLHSREGLPALQEDHGRSVDGHRRRLRTGSGRMRRAPRRRMPGGAGTGQYRTDIDAPAFVRSRSTWANPAVQVAPPADTVAASSGQRSVQWPRRVPGPVTPRPKAAKVESCVARHWAIRRSGSGQRSVGMLAGLVVQALPSTKRSKLTPPIRARLSATST